MTAIIDAKCPCGREGRYVHNVHNLEGHFTMSCNKYRVCPSYDELLEQNKDQQKELRRLRHYMDCLPILISAVTSSRDPVTRSAIWEWDRARGRL